MSIKDMEKVRLFVWVDGEPTWSRIYLAKDGQFYIKTGAKSTDIDLLSNHHIDRTEEY